LYLQLEINFYSVMHKAYAYSPLESALWTLADLLQFKGI
jgi:hypothetical protein